MRALSHFLLRTMQSILLAAAGVGLTYCADPVAVQAVRTDVPKAASVGTVQFSGGGQFYTVALAGTAEALGPGVLVIEDSTYQQLSHTRLAGFTATGYERTSDKSFVVGGDSLRITYTITADGKLKGIETRRDGRLFLVVNLAVNNGGSFSPGEYTVGDSVPMMNLHLVPPEGSPDLSIDQVAGPFGCAAAVVGYAASVVAYFGALAAFSAVPSPPTAAAVIAAGGWVVSMALAIADQC